MAALLAFVSCDATIANNLVAASAVAGFDCNLLATGADHHSGEEAVWACVECAQLGLELLERRVY